MAEKEFKPTISVEQERDIVFSPVSSVEKIDSEENVNVTPALDVEAVSESPKPIVEDSSSTRAVPISYGFYPDVSKGPGKVVSEKGLGDSPRV
jgi:hypothetical protein